MKKCILLLLLVFNGIVSANEPDELPDKRAYFVGKVGERYFQLDLEWFGESVKGNICMGDKLDNISGKVAGSFERGMELNGGLGEWNLQRRFDPNYIGTYVTQGQKHDVKLVRVAEWMNMTISFAGQSDIKVSYPYILHNNVVSEKVNELLETNHVKLENQYMSYLKEADYFYLGISTRFDCRKRTSITHYSNELISLTIEYDIYSGGAHGIYGKETINVIERDCKAFQLNLEDLLVDDNGMLELCRLVRGKLENLEGVDFIPKNDEKMAKLLNNFYITSECITFYFGPYLLGSYAAGDFEVTIRWDQLEDIVDKGGILRKFNKSRN